MTHTPSEIRTAAAALYAVEAALDRYEEALQYDWLDHDGAAIYQALRTAHAALVDVARREDILRNGCQHMSGHGDTVIENGTVRVVRFTCDDCGEIMFEDIEHWTYATPAWYQRDISEYQFWSRHSMAGVFMSDSGPDRLALI